MTLSTGPTLYRGSATPTTGRTGDLWVNTTDSPPVLNICLDNTPTWVELGSMKPTTVTQYTTGSGNHSIAAGTWVRVTLVGGGGGGGGKGGNAPVYAGGGGGGQTITKFYRVDDTSVPYSVGAGGAGGSTSGSNGGTGGSTRFGPLVAEGGGGGAGKNVTSNASAGGYGGGLVIYGSGIDTSIGSYTVNCPIVFGSGEVNIPGGCGGTGYSNSEHSRYAGWPDRFAGPIYTASSVSLPGSGGCSVYGLGGVAVLNQNGAGGSGYGAGGAGAGSSTNTDYTGGAGSGGLIIVEEYGVW